MRCLRHEYLAEEPTNPSTFLFPSPLAFRAFLWRGVLLVSLHPVIPCLRALVLDSFLLLICCTGVFHCTLATLICDVIGQPSRVDVLLHGLGFFLFSDVSTHRPALQKVGRYVRNLASRPDVARWRRGLCKL